MQERTTFEADELSLWRTAEILVTGLARTLEVIRNSGPLALKLLVGKLASRLLQGGRVHMATGQLWASCDGS